MPKNENPNWYKDNPLYRTPFRN